MTSSTVRALTLVSVLMVSVAACSTSSERQPKAATSCGLLSPTDSDYDAKIRLGNECMRDAWLQHRAAKLVLGGHSVEGDAFTVTFRVVSDRSVTYTNATANGVGHIKCNVQVWLNSQGSGCR